MLFYKSYVNIVFEAVMGIDQGPLAMEVVRTLVSQKYGMITNNTYL